MSFPDRLRALRERRGWSQSDLALKIGKTLATVSRWERSIHPPGMEELLTLADVFGVTLDDLVGRAEPSPPVDPMEGRLAHLEEVQHLQERAMADLAAAFLELAREHRRTNELLEQSLREGPSSVEMVRELKGLRKESAATRQRVEMIDQALQRQGKFADGKFYRRSQGAPSSEDAEAEGA